LKRTRKEAQRFSSLEMASLLLFDFRIQAFLPQRLGVIESLPGASSRRPERLSLRLAAEIHRCQASTCDRLKI